MAIERSFTDEAERLAYDVTRPNVGKLYQQLEGTGSFWRPLKSGKGADVWERVDGLPSFADILPSILPEVDVASQTLAEDLHAALLDLGLIVEPVT
jgi:hypothetical protein